MRSKDEIRKYLEIREDTFRKNYFNLDIEEYCKEQGFIEALEWVLQEQTNEK